MEDDTESEKVEFGIALGEFLGDCFSALTPVAWKELLEAVKESVLGAKGVGAVSVSLPENLTSPLCDYLGPGSSSCIHLALGPEEMNDALIRFFSSVTDFSNEAFTRHYSGIESILREQPYPQISFVSFSNEFVQYFYRTVKEKERFPFAAVEEIEKALPLTRIIQGCNDTLRMFLIYNATVIFLIGPGPKTFSQMKRALNICEAGLKKGVDMEIVSRERDWLREQLQVLAFALDTLTGECLNNYTPPKDGNEKKCVFIPPSLTQIPMDSSKKSDFNMRCFAKTVTCFRLFSQQLYSDVVNACNNEMGKKIANEVPSMMYMKVLSLLRMGCSEVCRNECVELLKREALKPIHSVLANVLAFISLQRKETRVEAIMHMEKVLNSTTNRKHFLFNLSLILHIQENFDDEFSVLEVIGKDLRSEKQNISICEENDLSRALKGSLFKHFQEGALAFPHCLKAHRTLLFPLYLYRAGLCCATRKKFGEAEKLLTGCLRIIEKDKTCSFVSKCTLLQQLAYVLFNARKPVNCLAVCCELKRMELQFSIWRAYLEISCFISLGRVDKAVSLCSVAVQEYLNIRSGELREGETGVASVLCAWAILLRKRRALRESSDKLKSACIILSPNTFHKYDSSFSIVCNFALDLIDQGKKNEAVSIIEGYKMDLICNVSGNQLNIVNAFKAFKQRC
eukprot:Nk52_evm65s215 gene=Nk52_evmTU65s215